MTLVLETSGFLEMASGELPSEQNHHCTEQKNTGWFWNGGSRRNIGGQEIGAGEKRFAAGERNPLWQEDSGGGIAAEEIA